MKRLLVVVLLLWSVRADASGTLRTSATNSNGGSASSVAAASAGAVTAGDLAVVACGNDSAATVSSVTDGGSTFTADTNNASGSVAWQYFYVVSSTQSGTVTYTCNFSGASFSREIQVLVFSHTAAVSFDTSIATGAGATGTALASGNITTTGTDEIIVGGGYGENATGYTVQQINGTNATGNVGIGVSTLFYVTAASTFTGQSTTTANASGRWVCNTIAFKIAGGAAAPKRLTLMGVGEVD